MGKDCLYESKGISCQLLQIYTRFLHETGGLEYGNATIGNEKKDEEESSQTETDSGAKREKEIV